MPSKLPQRAALSAPAVVTEPAPDPFQVEPAHHRWLLTTCVAGIAGSLVIGSAVLGIFGENAAPRDAYASVEKASISGLYPKSAETGRSLIGRKEFSATYQPQADDAERSVVPERDLEVKRDVPRSPIERPGVYVLQAGSYRKLEDAQRVQNQLLKLGVEANLQRVAVDADEWHRVRIGPLTDLDEVNRLRTRLRASGLEPLVIRVGD